MLASSSKKFNGFVVKLILKQAKISGELLLSHYPLSSDCWRVHGCQIPSKNPDPDLFLGFHAWTTSQVHPIRTQRLDHVCLHFIRRSEFWVQSEKGSSASHRGFEQWAWGREFWEHGIESGSFRSYCRWVSGTLILLWVWIFHEFLRL